MGTVTLQLHLDCLIEEVNCPITYCQWCFLCYLTFNNGSVTLYCNPGFNNNKMGENVSLLKGNYSLLWGSVVSVKTRFFWIFSKIIT